MHKLPQSKNHRRADRLMAIVINSYALVGNSKRRVTNAVGMVTAPEERTTLRMNAGIRAFPPPVLAGQRAKRGRSGATGQVRDRVGADALAGGVGQEEAVSDECGAPVDDRAIRHLQRLRQLAGSKDFNLASDEIVKEPPLLDVLCKNLLKI